VFRLTIQSSYAHNVEFAAVGDRFDSVQWWFAETEAWRVKTFAADLDLHPHHIRGPITEQIAIETTLKNYGDVIAERFAVHFEDPFDTAEVERVLAGRGGAAALENVPDRFSFWNPAQLEFRSKTEPA
jgi:hypothetical protein